MDRSPFPRNPGALGEAEEGDDREIEPSGIVRVASWVVPVAAVVDDEEGELVGEPVVFAAGRTRTRRPWADDETEVEADDDDGHRRGTPVSPVAMNAERP